MYLKIKRMKFSLYCATFSSSSWEQTLNLLRCRAAQYHPTSPFDASAEQLHGKLRESALPLLPIKMRLFTAAWVTAKSSTPLLQFPESSPSNVSQLPVQQRCYCCTGAQSLKHCPDETKAREEPPLSPQQRWGQQRLFFPEFPDLPEKASSTSEWVTKKTTFPYTMEFLKKNLCYRRMRLL